MNKIKSLIAKDLIILKSSKKSMLTVLILYIILILANKDSADILIVGSMMIIFMFALFSLSTFNYDEKSNTDKYILTLPVDKKSVLKAKYLLLIISILFGIIVSIIFAIIVNIFGIIKFGNLEEYVASLLGLIWGISILISIQIPCIYKFGAEKGRLSMYIVLMAIIAIGGIIIYVFPKPDLTFLDNLEKFIPYILIAIIILNFTVSYLISKKIYLKKEV